MNLKEACEYVFSKWKYKSDPDLLFDDYKFPEDGKTIEGDCDNVPFAVLEKMHGKKKALWLILNPLSNVTLYRAKTKDGGGHLVTKYGDMWLIISQESLYLKTNSLK